MPILYQKRRRYEIFHKMIRVRLETRSPMVYWGLGTTPTSRHPAPPPIIKVETLHGTAPSIHYNPGG